MITINFHRHVAVLLVMLCTSLSHAQSCLLSGIAFSTQQQIDDFAANYPGCTEVLGNVFIEEATSGNITNLAGLAQITNIRGALTIQNNNALTTLSGLDMLTSIGDGGSASLSLFKASSSNLRGLRNVIVEDGFLRVESNAALTSLGGLDMLNSVLGSVRVVSNPALTSLSSLNNLSSIGTYLNLTNNAVLIGLNGLDNIDYTSITDIILENSPLLSFCEIQSICDYLDVPANPATISGNATGCNSRAEVESTCALVPIVLASFNARITENGDAILHWQTLSEINSHGFSIEWSRNNQGWAELDFIAGKGNSSEITGYEYVHNKPGTGTNYYRLKMLDLDGSYEYSEVVSVYIEKTDEATIFPNPTNGRIDIQGLNQESNSIYVYDHTGTLVNSGTLTDGRYDITELRNGIYILEVRDDTRLYNFKVVKL